MPHDLKQLLLDIEEMIVFVQNQLDRVSRERYDSDRALRLMVERSLQVIGEAVVRIRNEHPEHVIQIRDFRRIVQTRNILSHAYDGIDHNIIWQIVQEHLRLLLEDVRRLIQG